MILFNLVSIAGIASLQALQHLVKEIGSFQAMSAGIFAGLSLPP